MRLTLSSLVLASAVVAAAVAVTPQVASATRVHVPFSFNAGGKVMPAGDYNVVREPSRQFVTMIDPSGRATRTWLLGPGEPKGSSTAVVLSFDQTENGALLRTVQYGPMITSQIDKKLLHNDDTRVHVIRGE